MHLLFLSWLTLVLRRLCVPTPIHCNSKPSILAVDSCWSARTQHASNAQGADDSHPRLRAYLHLAISQLALTIVLPFFPSSILSVHAISPLRTSIMSRARPTLSSPPSSHYSWPSSFLVARGLIMRPPRASQLTPVPLSS